MSRTFFTSLVGLCFGVASVMAQESHDRWIYPSRLKPGDTIMFVAPARHADKEMTERAKRRVEARGYRVIIPDGMFARQSYLAGSDKRRAREIMAAFKDPEVDAVFPVTGGYGTMRILDQLDYDVIRANPKPLIGFSDITGIHLALNKKAHLVTFHSPNPDTGLGKEDGMTPFSAKWFWAALATSGNPEKSATGYLIQVLSDQAAQPTTMVGGRATGRLIGGNLTLICMLLGTPYQIETRDRILFIEDVDEPPYKVDRYLTQLRLAGLLDGLRGAVIGQFTRSRTDDAPGDIPAILESFFKPLGVPVIANFPTGHVDNNATMPLGARAEIDADACTIRVVDGPG